MQWNNPKNTRMIAWTKHAIVKMRLYGISEQKVKQILRTPVRREEGVAPDTQAVMCPFGSPTKDGRLPYRGETWVMTEQKDKKSKIKIISVWKYPGKSPERGPVPIPEDSLRELV